MIRCLDPPDIRNPPEEGKQVGYAKKGADEKIRTRDLEYYRIRDGARQRQAVRRGGMELRERPVHGWAEAANQSVRLANSLRSSSPTASSPCALLLHPVPPLTTMSLSIFNAARKLRILYPPLTHFLTHHTL